jgi:hypothetical protein
MKQPRYTQTQFLNLIDAVEEQGGMHADELCENRYITEFAGGNEFVKGHELVMCNEVAIFRVPYKGEKDKTGEVRVCAVDDGMLWWPRFRKEVGEE